MHVPGRVESDWLQLPREHRRTAPSHTPPEATHSTATHVFVSCEHTEFEHWLLVVQAVPIGPGAPHVAFKHVSDSRQSDSEVHAAPAAPRVVHFTTAGELPSRLQTRPSAHLAGAESGFAGS